MNVCDKRTASATPMGSHKNHIELFKLDTALKTDVIGLLSAPASPGEMKKRFWV
jgi:hypothetical protein